MATNSLDSAYGRWRAEVQRRLTKCLIEAFPNLPIDATDAKNLVASMEDHGLYIDLEENQHGK